MATTTFLGLERAGGGGDAGRGAARAAASGVIPAVAVVGVASGAEGAGAEAPAAIRAASRTLRYGYNPNQRVDVAAKLRAVDGGDLTGRDDGGAASALGALHAAGTAPLVLGGDHAALLAGLRAAAQQHGPLALLQFDAHLPGAPEHDGVVQQVVDEGLVDPARSTLCGARGALEGATDLERLRDLGFLVFVWEELMQFGTGPVANAVDRARGKAYLSFDLDFVDPSAAPGVATPVCGGPTATQALALVRAARGLDPAAADVLGFAPVHEVGRLTALLAATVAWEILTLFACTQATT